MITETLLAWFRELWAGIEPALPALTTSFFSVLIGAFPFIVIAAFASAIIEVFVSKDAIARLVPRRGVLGVLLAPIMGIVIPMCECGIIPVARRMVQKGVPASAAITFMLANPILNPLAIYATYLAFPKPLTLGFGESTVSVSIVAWRMGLGYLVSVLIGMGIHYFYGRRQAEEILHERYLQREVAASAEAAHECGAGCDHDHSHSHEGQTLGQKIQATLDHAATEFFDVLKYFVVGAGIAAISQSMINRTLLEAIGGGLLMSVIIMMIFAFIICICSEADAFVAAAFASTFTPGALLAFLVAGPMTDIKNVMMMNAAFKARFVIWLNVAIFGLVGLFTVALNLWIYR